MASGGQVTGIVSLGALASSRDGSLHEVVVTLNATRRRAATDAVTVPSSITILAGRLSAAFQVQAGVVAEETEVSVWAQIPAGGGSATLVVTPPPPPTTRILDSIAVAPGRLLGGGQVTGTVTVVGSAPAGGVVVTLTSGDLTLARVGESVTVPEGQRTATFAVSTAPVSVQKTVQITARAGLVTKTASIVLVPSAALDSLTISPASVKSGAQATGTVTLSRAAPAGGLAVQLDSADRDAARVPPSVTVKEGVASAQFPVAAGQAGAKGKTVTISATAGGVTKTATLTVQK